MLMVRDETDDGKEWIVVVDEDGGCFTRKKR
jgi:hypothetical protein